MVLLSDIEAYSNFISVAVIKNTLAKCHLGEKGFIWVEIPGYSLCGGGEEVKPRTQSSSQS